MNLTCNIIVIGYDLPEIEIECLQSIIKYTKWPYILTFYDNYEKKTSLTKIWNHLIFTSPANYICLLNNDVEVTEGWLTKLMDTLLSDDSYGFIGPSTDNCHSPQKQLNTPEKAAQNPGIEIMDQPISGFCITFARALWEHLGKFDERFSFYGQESKLQALAQDEGFKLVWRHDAFVWHMGEMSVKKSGIDVKAERERAKKLYWSERGEV